MDIQVNQANFGAQISGVEVYLDNILVGLTDITGQISLIGLSYGTHNIRVTKYGYYEVQQDFSVPEDTTISIVLTPITVDVTVTVSE